LCLMECYRLCGPHAGRATNLARLCHRRARPVITVWAFSGRGDAGRDVYHRALVLAGEGVERCGVVWGQDEPYVPVLAKMPGAGDRPAQRGWLCNTWAAAISRVGAGRTTLYLRCET